MVTKRVLYKTASYIFKFTCRIIIYFIYNINYDIKLFKNYYYNILIIL